MNPLIFTDAFTSTHTGVKQCFCGKPTIEDHDFWFCSPECARADSLRTLGGQGDYHYRNIMQKACSNSAAPKHVLLRHKSERQLRSVSIARRGSVSQQAQHFPKPTKTLHTLEEVTTEILAGEGRSEGINTSVHGPVAKIPRESSVTGAILQEMEEENEEEAAWQKLANHTDDRSKPPTLDWHHGVGQTTANRRSRFIRRSASFACLDEQIAYWNGERGPVMEVVFQLRQAWNEMTETDIMPDFEKSDSDEED
ncbi:uncharacterized protein HD556DRAFT_101742 [Suillus plorans]|uniref:Uncharacterized protein n=1 Tax=Suillus plorans TaxID=116603 RepID=A0A9P7DAL4_9AGAM|nr:uncharacterized protein HD556DRAFT_101742 [Suillus plorans]KAG1785624.1 hypothetical protein HD556DRAFT_101742 [Suillus plorans]